MKLLVLGFDGGTQRIFENMPMPFTNDFLLNNKSRILKEDLISRGWAKILSGLHSSQTNALYLMPLGDKSLKFTQSYSLQDLMANDYVVPLWELLNKRGIKVGIQNIPTTNPAPEVDGFLVSGGGGGLSSMGGIPEHMVYPKENATILNKMGYTVDIRLGAPGNNTFSDFVLNIEKAHEKQLSAYIELCKKHKPNFGFFCFRITTELQYLAMSEIESYISEVSDAYKEKREPKPKTDIQKWLIRHYEHMDICIKRLVEFLNPSHILYTADHSTAPFHYDFNVNVFLEQQGWFNRASSYNNLKQRLIKSVKQAVPAGLKKGIKTKLNIPSIRTSPTQIDKSATKAFGTFFDTGNFAGIFVNDQNRFNGPVKNDQEVKKLCSQICEELNQSSEAKTHCLHAKPFRERFSNFKYQHNLPDIRIEKPDDCYFSCRMPNFVEKNPNYGPLPMNIQELKYPNTGLKGQNPIFAFSNELEQFINEDDPNDLRVVYRIIDRVFR